MAAAEQLGAALAAEQLVQPVAERAAIQLNAAAAATTASQQRTKGHPHIVLYKKLK